MRKREEIANHVITKVEPEWLEYLKAVHPDKLVTTVQLHFANHCIEYTILEDAANKTTDNGAFFFTENLVTVHFPKDKSILDDKSYRVLSSGWDWHIEICDEVYCSTYDVEVDMLTPDTAEVTELWKK